MPRKLFCEISPLTYRISVEKCRLVRLLQDAVSGLRFSREIHTPLPIVVYRHASLIRRRLSGVDMTLQENKAVNLSLAAPKLSGVVIRPGETFSLWHLVGSVTEQKGYRTGLTICRGVPQAGIGGGMCQLSNLIHWLGLHTPLTITEHHHHDGVDLFPDHNRQIPFGTGTSILYNYIDYRFTNTTDRTYQLQVWVDGDYLRGELRANLPQPEKYHICCENERFVRETDGVVYRCGEVFRVHIDCKTGVHLEKELLRINHAAVLYNCSHLSVENKETPTT